MKSVRTLGPIILCFLFIALSSPLLKAADSMNTFLTSCAYGTAGGAVLGLASLAFSEDPGGKVSSVAKGASLGLYFGIAMGFYLINTAPGPTEVLQQKEPGYLLAPIFNDYNLDGAQVMINLVRY